MLLLAGRLAGLLVGLMDRAKLCARWKSHPVSSPTVRSVRGRRCRHRLLKVVGGCVVCLCVSGRLKRLLVALSSCLINTTVTVSVDVVDYMDILFLIEWDCCTTVDAWREM